MIRSRSLPPTLALLFWVALVEGEPQQSPQDSQPQPNPKQQAAAADPFTMDLDSLANIKVITASKFSEKLSDAPSVMSVVTADELKRFGGMTLREVLERVAGLILSNGSANDRGVLAVGGDGNEGHILFLINGRPVREVLQGGTSGDLLESFPVNILERVEVIKGPGSVLYGSDAAAGVINLITKKAVGRNFHLSSAAAPEGGVAESEEFLLDRGGLSVVEGAQYHRAPGGETLFVSSTGMGPMSTLSAGQQSMLDSGTGAYLGASYKGLTFMSSYTSLESTSFFFQQLADVRWKKGFFDVGYSFKPTAKWEMSFALTYTRSTLDAPVEPQVRRDSYEALLEWTNFYTFSDKDRLTFGALYNHEQGTEVYLGATPTFIDVQGARSGSEFYVQHEHKLTSDLKLIGGVQANKIGDLSINLVPRAGILWNPLPHTTLKTLYGGAYHAPSLFQTLINYPLLKGNPNLLPEKVGTLDVQLGYENNRVQGNVGYFHTRETNLIVPSATSPAIETNLRQAAVFQGAEAEGKYYFHRNWFLMGSGIYFATHSGVGLSNVAPIPSFGAKAGVSYSAKGGTDISLFDAYQGHIAGFTTALNPHPDANHSLNAHLRFDLTKHWRKDDAAGLALFLHADNLTNQRVWLPDTFAFPPDTNPLNLRRTVFLGVELWQKRE